MKEKNGSWLIKKGKLEYSGTYEFNFLFNQGKFYIMDNHLFAAWCWMQKIKTDEKYGLFHIDRHYDYMQNLSKEFINENKKLLSGNLKEYLSVKDNSTGPSAARFDNSIDLFRKLYPNILVDFYFVTHEDGNHPEDIKITEIGIWELQEGFSNWMKESDCKKWILNIDLDFFFQDKGSEQFKFLTNKYVYYICQEIEKVIDDIEVITIALSPNYCGGWEPAFETLKIITDHFSIGFNMNFK